MPSTPPLFALIGVALGIPCDGAVAPAVLIGATDLSVLLAVFTPVAVGESIDPVELVPAATITYVQSLSNGLDNEHWVVIGRDPQFDIGRWPVADFETEIMGRDGPFLRLTPILDDAMTSGPSRRGTLAAKGRRPKDTLHGSLGPDGWWLRRTLDTVGRHELSTEPPVMMRHRPARPVVRLPMVEVVIPQAMNLDQVHDLEDALAAHLRRVRGASIDGNAVSPDEAIIYVVAPDPSRVRARIERLVAKGKMPAGTHVVGAEPSDQR